MISKPFEQIVTGECTSTDRRTITEDYVRQFADLTWDRHPLHLDPDYAAKTRFGRQIAHGALMISTLLGLVELHPSYLQCFYGLDKLRFMAPAYIGDTVHAATTIASVKPRADGASAVVTAQVELLNEEDQALLAGEFSMLVAGAAQAMDDPRPAPEQNSTQQSSDVAP
ncbi:MaoC family dehydratase [Brevibacterium aurantiacum]|uniref:Acyl dehydratase n=1 Tax=Brevibacterium aurantiacum TaxID=273384 RepID=A0A2H1KMV1_BREAU|nr:MaoC/PaaZ C-terminal domain-containing protein [Brevibacterium aurantiacum]SMY01133.1 Acyl dehydratase [Brevibacterium aurantiacum]